MSSSPYVLLSSTLKYSVFAVDPSSTPPTSSSSKTTSATSSSFQQSAKLAPSSTHPAHAAPPKASASEEEKEQIENFLLTVASGTCADSQLLAKEKGWNHDVVVSVVKSLEADSYLIGVTTKQKFQSLTAEGKDALENGSPEVRLLSKVRSGEITSVAQITDKVGHLQCMKRGWLKVQEGKLVLDKAPEPKDSDETRSGLQVFSTTPSALADKDKKELIKRKLIEEKERTTYALAPGPRFSSTRKKAAADLTKAMLDDGSWTTETVKPVNWNSMGLPPGGGTLHPLLKVRFEFRKILIGMGFEEMPTNRWVESSFWNFDSLFQPQQVCLPL